MWGFELLYAYTPRACHAVPAALIPAADHITSAGAAVPTGTAGSCYTSFFFATMWRAILAD